MMAIRKSRNI